MAAGTDVFKYNTLFYPGDFYIFWNVLVPLSVLINIRNCGLRAHEIGLLIALSLNPLILKYVLHSPAMAWGISLFLIVWIQRVLRKWYYYNIYTMSFLKAMGMMAVFVALPSLVLRAVWEPLADAMEAILTAAMGDAPCQVVVQARDLVMLCGAVMLLLHSFYFYNAYNDCLKPTCIKKPICKPSTSRGSRCRKR